MLRVYCWEKNQPAKFDKTDYQTIPIILHFTLFLFIYFVATQKRLSPDPEVGLGARLPCSQIKPTSWTKRTGEQFESQSKLIF